MEFVILDLVIRCLPYRVNKVFSEDKILAQYSIIF